MGIILIALIIVVAVIVLLSLFAPEKLPWYRPHLILEKATKVEPIKTQEIVQQPMVMEGLAEPESDFHISLDENVARLETILFEKNTIIEKLQRELAAEKTHRGEFEKIKAILDEEIQKLKIKNKELKNQTGEKNG